MTSPSLKRGERTSVLSQTFASTSPVRSPRVRLRNGMDQLSETLEILDNEDPIQVARKVIKQLQERVEAGEIINDVPKEHWQRWVDGVDFMAFGARL